MRTAILTGASVVAGEERSGDTATFRTVDPRTGEPGTIEYHDASRADIEAACSAAERAAGALANAPRGVLAALLAGIAGGLGRAGDDLIDVADAESALGRVRLSGELGRTCGQLRVFADMVEKGRHLEPIIDHGGDAGPDVRRTLIPIGPVAVFGASNFPLAFSVPGGDTASALAAGCPVVVKGHPSHPGTSEFCARIISDEVAAAGLPAGVFSMLQGAGVDVGQALVLAPAIRAVGFTGSLRGGRALHDLAATRPTPIPVYAEMGSLNPVFLSTAALTARGAAIAKEIAASILQGCGQFCTKPGLVFLPPGDGGDAFVRNLELSLRDSEPAPMLDPSIHKAFRETLAKTTDVDGIELVGDGPSAGLKKGLWMTPSLLQTDLSTFLERPELTEEHFGPAAIVVRCEESRMQEAAHRIEGSLTATLHLEPDADDQLYGSLLPEITRFAGRIVFNGVPTGVAVVAAMQHGGPYPATASAGHTSVGLTAVRRFLRPIAFQDAPEKWLPEALRKQVEVHRLVDGHWEGETG